MNPKKLGYLSSLMCVISLSADLPGERILRDENGEGGDGGGGGGNPPKTFTQDEVNTFLARERKKLETKYADYDDVKAKAAKVDEHEKQIAELSEKLELAGKSEAEKAKLIAEKMQAQQAAQLSALAKERDDAKAAAEASTKALRDTQVRYQATAALTAAKALPSSMKHATALFVAETKIETDVDEETGAIAIKAVEYDGVPYADPTKAAEAWLKANPHFAAAVAGGGGTRNPNGTGTGKSHDTMSAAELAEVGLNALSNRR